MWRTPAGISTVKRIATEIGMTDIETGRASIGASVTPQVLHSVFGLSVADPRQNPEGRGAIRVSRDAVSWGPAEEELAIPTPLRPYVQTITIAPPHTQHVR